MNNVNNKEVVRKQYVNSNNLETRISIHEKYSVNKEGFDNWIISHYESKKGIRVLELGCGNGNMWKGKEDLIKKCSVFIMSDFSEGMVKATKETLGTDLPITYQVIDIQNIPYEDENFDVVIANMMLYHVPDLDKGLMEVQRVLKSEGKFYCATYGEHGITEYIANLINNEDVQDNLNKNFTLQNGKEILSSYFADIKHLDYPDALEVTEMDDLVDYVYSLTAMSNIKNVERTILKNILQDNAVNGVLRVPKEYGMFVCTKKGEF